MFTQKRIVKSAAAAMLIGTTCLVPLVLSRPAAAQSSTQQNIIPQSEAVTLQGKIKKIDSKNRVITLEGPTGEKVKVVAGPLVRLDMLKVGDTVNAKYYRSVAFMLNGPAGGNGTPVSNDQMAAAAMQPAEAPGGIAVGMTKISGTVVGIDLASNTVSVVNPSGGMIYTIDVTDPARQAMLGSLNVGDTITAVVSQVLAVSITPAPKHWW